MWEGYYSTTMSIKGLTYQTSAGIILHQSLHGIQETCISGQFRRMNEQVLIKVPAENNRYLDNTLTLFVHCPAGCASRIHNMQGRNTAKKKSVSELETESNTYIPDKYPVHRRLYRIRSQVIILQPEFRGISGSADAHIDIFPYKAQFNNNRLNYILL